MRLGLNKDPKNISEQDLIQKCIADDRQYQEILYRKYADYMYNVCLTYIPDEDAVCDVLQDGFIKVFRNLHKFKSEASLGSWIRRIMVNTALDHYRNQKRQHEKIEMLSSLPNEKSIAGILEQINAQELINMVNQLPSKAAMVLKLYAIEGYGHKEIAEMMDISEGTSKSQLFRARALLKELIDKYNG